MILALVLSSLAASFATPRECMHIGPLYWEIGDQRGTIEYEIHGSAVHSESLLPADFASSWLFAAYVAQTRKLDQGDKDALRMASGYSGMTRKACLFAKTVGECAQKAGSFDPLERGKPVYDQAPLQKWAAANGLGKDTAARLGKRVGDALHIRLEMRAPQPATGVFISATAYALFLRKLLHGDLALSRLLAKDALGDVQGSRAPKSWRYSYGHFVEDDGTLSSPGNFGFYPWIAGKTYGIVARRSASRLAFVESLACGRALREAYAKAHP
ncbi:MAG TPA: hypothetical protein VGH20_12170 [Myxococcales bacterium]|jgi:hypothetical protein